jgi:hypothetical protein
LVEEIDNAKGMPESPISLRTVAVPGTGYTLDKSWKLAEIRGHFRCQDHRAHDYLDEIVLRGCFGFKAGMGDLLQQEGLIGDFRIRFSELGFMQPALR